MFQCNIQNDFEHNIFLSLQSASFKISFGNLCFVCLPLYRIKRTKWNFSCLFLPRCSTIKTKGLVNVTIWLVPSPLKVSLCSGLDGMRDNTKFTTVNSRLTRFVTLFWLSVASFSILVTFSDTSLCIFSIAFWIDFILLMGSSCVWVNDWVVRSKSWFGL